MVDPKRILDVQILIRNDTAANWTSANPILSLGEMGLETDTNRFKFGDGVTPWVDLKYGAAPAIILTAIPTHLDWNYLVGTVAIVHTSRIFILVGTAMNAGQWVELITPGHIEDAMFRSVFATNANWNEGYVDKAVEAGRLIQEREISITGDVVAPAVAFNGTQNVPLSASLAEIAELAGGGVFIKVIVDSKGRVVGHEALLAEDIPMLTLAKIADAGTAAAKNVGTAIGQVVVVTADGHIDPSIMPPITITDVFVVDSEVAMLSLMATQGDIVIRTDERKTFILATGVPTLLENWKEIQTPLNGVQLVNNKPGPYVTLDTDDIAEGDINKYHTAERVVEVMGTQASTVLTDGATILHDNEILILDGGNAAGHTG